MAKRIILFIALLAAGALARAAIPVVASTTSAEMLLREIGGDYVSITTLAPRATVVRRAT